MSLRRISSQQLKHLVFDAQELAILDVGEEGQYGEAHLLRAANAPYSLLESIAPTLVPRKTCLVVLADHGEDVSARAAARLTDIGYTNIAVLEGGVPAWAAAGFEVFKGVFVPSKAYGEWLGHGLRTPEISAHDLQVLTARSPAREEGDGEGAKHGSGDGVVILDPRTVPEHAARHVPGAIACPGAELALRFDELVPDAQTTVVVACGGRTRGLVGAQTLLDAGVPNPVMALADGNHGWQLAGYPLEEGLRSSFSFTGPHANDKAFERAKALRSRSGIQVIDETALASWRQDETRTTYTFDVRTREEYDAAHLSGAMHAPGGQLVQATDRWVAVRGARIVLVDTDGVRATSVAVHLQRMGWETHVLTWEAGAVSHHGDGAAVSLPSGSKAADAAARVSTPLTEVVGDIPDFSPEEAAEALASGSVALDAGLSQEFLDGSACGPAWRSHWVTRASLGRWIEAAAQGQPLIIFSSDGLAARLVGLDLLREAPGSSIHVVQGGLLRWKAEGLSVLARDPSELHRQERIDTLYWARERRHGDQAAMRMYLAWEHQLLAQVQRDEADFPSAFALAAISAISASH
ncbi:rhodanese-like domain-containing protein [Ottowia thiooxydans]|uniref:rhodanese-like domain-containing protein n=1 Tax=Ottowia thiooxydans TaxID=219182 RepID=UPI0003FD810B|nr:rhodanese-like domain-containing protein [Ottowia thiooxydans]